MDIGFQRGVVSFHVSEASIYEAFLHIQLLTLVIDNLLQHTELCIIISLEKSQVANSKTSFLTASGVVGVKLLFMWEKVLLST